MAILKPRNRVLIFRLTEDEYSHLHSACSTDGARSLSDFARTRLLGSLAVSEPAPSIVEQKLEDLQSQMRLVVERLQAQPAIADSAVAAGAE